MVTVSDFGLGDWPPPGSDAGPRHWRLHLMYLPVAKRLGVPRGRLFSIADVAKRDGWRCHACGEPVPQRWTAAQLDQTPALTFATAWSEGGGYDEANARLAHHGCAVFPDAAFGRRLGQLLVRDLSVKARAGRRDETCTEGHPLTGANLLKASDGRRRCRQCRRDREAAGTTPNRA
jgi:hypothetical protein